MPHDACQLTEARTKSVRELLYTLLREYAWNATAYQIVNPGIEHWFSPEGDAVIGYVTRGRVRVVAGAPAQRGVAG